MSSDKMFWPVPGFEQVSARFDQMRPLSRPVAERTHVHGAIDIPAPVGTVIVAPESGVLYYMALMRRSDAFSGAELMRHVKWGEMMRQFDFAQHHFFYDIYGGLIVLEGDSGLTHIITHSYRNQLFNLAATRMGMEVRTVESPADQRWPDLTGEVSTAVVVTAGERIGYVGNAGFSTGAHAHCELHENFCWTPHADRPNPQEVYAA